ncbi:MAG: PH domain-containing protein [Anaerolineaceae bacterium]
MSYVDNSLVPGEQVIYRAKISLFVFITPLIWLVFLGFLVSKIQKSLLPLVILAGLYVIIRILLTYYSTEFALTNKRIIAKTGFIRRHSVEIMLSKLESITVAQSIDGRIWGYGTVTVVGSGGTREPFKLISKPMELRKVVNSHIPTTI